MNQNTENATIEGVTVARRYICPLTNKIIREHVSVGNVFYEHDAFLRNFLSQKALIQVAMSSTRNQKSYNETAEAIFTNNLLENNPNLIARNHVYLPESFYKRCFEAIEKSNLEEIKQLLKLDIRVFLMSPDEARNNKITTYLDTRNRNDRAGYFYACEIAERQKKKINGEIVILIAKRIEEFCNKHDLGFTFTSFLARKPVNWYQKALNCEFSFAARAGDVNRCIECLAMGANIETTDSYQFDLSGRKIEHCDSARTALIWAAYGRHSGVVDLLIRRGCNLDAQTSGGWTALHHAAYYGDKQIIDKLVTAGAKPTLQLSQTRYRFHRNSTPLHVAVLNNHCDAVETLVDNMKNISTLDDLRRTALDIALFAKRQNPRIVEILLATSLLILIEIRQQNRIEANNERMQAPRTPM